MEPVFDPFVPRRSTMESDSDMDSNPHLSEGFTETDNDTPPETPLRATMGLGNEDQYTECGIKPDQNASCARTPVMPAPARFSEPLQIATPNPIRPVPYAIRSFGCSNLDEEDRGYDSEREGRPGFRRFRSFQSLATEHDKNIAKRPGLPTRAASFVVRKPGEGRFASTSGPGFHFFQHGFHNSPRPRQPSPMIPISSNEPIPDTVGCSAEVPALEEILGHPLSHEEEAQLWSDLMTCPLENIDVPALAPAPLVKNRSNESTGLGLGLPASIEADTWRVATVVPRGPAVDSSPQCADTPGISPVLYDDTDLSPLTLPRPLVSPAMTPWGNWDVFSEVDNRILYALETGTWSDEALSGINPML
ncbi:hypothetical protein BN14_07410 [Rhizoctonia solani AG-1 IB]|uniref:Uncharacterized protein n=1 Tax=Thanatephorus cucumeris (strain AG1-IB / isolate 7/3/14) TaxID=1108050 RepID=M5C2S7_THACB|nr:hypothetical protein BN14_07410 [Rhizoctonia solani AG-1 IB]